MHEVTFSTQTLPNLLTDIDGSYDKPAIIMASDKVSRRQITYGELTSRIRRISSGFSRLGVRKESRVGALLPNGIEFVECWFAASSLGAIFVPFNTALKPKLLEYQIKDSEIKTLCYEQLLAENIPESVQTDKMKFIKVESLSKNTSSRDLHNSIEFESLADKKEAQLIDSKVVPSDPATILYSSGTTGDPKGVVLPHFAYINRVQEISNLFGGEEGGGLVYLNTLPMFHTSGQVMTTLPALMDEGTVVIDHWFHASRFWRVASQYKAQFSFLLMTMLNYLIKRGEEFVKNDLRVILCGGASLETWRKFESNFGVRLLEGYGLTETCGVALFNSLSNFKVGSIGKPLNSVHVSILDARGETCAPNQSGEICLKPRLPSTMMIEYLGKDDETRHAWKSGWLHTGDIGYVDIEGFYHFLERKKDMIRRRGENISPSDIERVVSQHQNILDCCAVGITSSLGEEDIDLYVVLKYEIIDFMPFLKWLDKELPFYMMPTRVHIVETLPKTPNHKVQRSKLRQGEVTILKTVIVAQTGFKATKPSLSR